MKVELIRRVLIGVPMGVSMGTLISIICLLIYAKGYYSPVHPELVNQFGSEIIAVIVQTLLCGVIGGVFSGASIIWEKDKWSLTKQSIIVLGIYLVTFIPISYFLKWMHLSFWGMFSYIAMFFFIFFSIWISLYIYTKKSVAEINEQIK